MKANWKIALLCFATILVACEKKDAADDQNQSGNQSTTPSSYAGSPISVKDKSVADWDALDPSKVAIATIAEKPLWSALRELRVYADEVYINYMLRIDPKQYTSHTSVDAMHIYMNADNNTNTGGFFDSFSDAGADLMFEAGLFDDEENPVPYSPTVHKWNGPQGADVAVEDRTGDWSVVWVAAGTIKGESQFIGDSIIEGRLVIDLIPGGFKDKAFGIGFDLQQNWENIGLLPQLNTPNGVNVGRTEMLSVTFDK